MSGMLALQKMPGKKNPYSIISATHLLLDINHDNEYNMNNEDEFDNDQGWG